MEDDLPPISPVPRHRGSRRFTLPRRGDARMMAVVTTPNAMTFCHTEPGILRDVTKRSRKLNPEYNVFKRIAECKQECARAREE
jgi:hypothetical protein